MDSGIQCLLETIETAFEVKFEPGEFDDNSRFEALYRALRSRQCGAAPHRCFTSIAFWRLRRSLADQLHVPKGSIKPATVVESVIPPMGRWRQWRTLGEATGLRLPKLKYSRKIAAAVFGLAFFFGLLVGLPVAIRGAQPGWMLAAWGIGAVASGILLYWLFKPVAASVPDGFGTFSSLAKTVAGLNYGGFVREFGPSRDRDLVEALGYVIGNLIDAVPGEVVSVLLCENPRLIDISPVDDDDPEPD